MELFCFLYNSLNYFGYSYGGESSLLVDKLVPLQK